MDEANFLIFDEPNNHLDLEAIVALGEALYNYKGVLLLLLTIEIDWCFANQDYKIEKVVQ